MPETIAKKVSWSDVEIELADAVHTVDISQLGFYEKDETGKKVPKTELKIKDLDNAALMILQEHPMVQDAPGSFDAPLSPKSQAYGLMLTYERISKGNNGNPGFTEAQFLKWTTTRTNRLVKAINDHLEAVQKKS